MGERDVEMLEGWMVTILTSKEIVFVWVCFGDYWGFRWWWVYCVCNSFMVTVMKMEATDP